MLDHILKSVTYDPNEPDPPSSKPCEHFDLICGTSSGGLLAILFGCLEMTCAEARSAYERLGRSMFIEDSHGAGPASPNRTAFILELEKIIESSTGDAHALMKGGKKPLCHVSDFAVDIICTPALTPLPLCDPASRFLSRLPRRVPLWLGPHHISFVTTPLQGERPNRLQLATDSQSKRQF